MTDGGGVFAPNADEVAVRFRPKAWKCAGDGRGSSSVVFAVAFRVSSFLYFNF